ncbi:MAG TPA: phosphate ABC transporter substrate-binding protein, partial [Azonexus sp.]|nr:phosphate ABC transporter substrate-binding protein [Azonexus sp.]
REIFVGNMQFAGALKLVPVDNGAVQGDFLSKVVKTEPERYATIWTKKSFRDGLNAPPVKSGDAEVIDFVKRTPGAIGYVGANPGSANVVLKY